MARLLTRQARPSNPSVGMSVGEVVGQVLDKLDKFRMLQNITQFVI
jgi:hypothetical protein